MTNQAQVDAVEHLLMAVISQQTDKDVERIFEKAQGSVMDSGGSGGPAQKGPAAEYLKHMQANIR